MQEWRGNESDSRRVSDCDCTCGVLCNTDDLRAPKRQLVKRVADKTGWSVGLSCRWGQQDRRTAGPLLQYTKNVQASANQQPQLSA